MAKISPFNAVRPTPNTVATVVSKSYVDYTPKERQLHIKKYPHSFLNIIDPGYDTTTQYALQERYAKVRERFLAYITQGIFIQDATPCYYVYKITTQHHTYCGIIALSSTQDYEDHVIKKHEDTLQQREIAFKKYLDSVRFNAEPVLLTYPDHPEIEKLIQEIMAQKVMYSFTTTDTQQHQVWKVTHPNTLLKISTAFENIDTLYIADGHHRCASSYRLSKTATSSESMGFFMSYLIPTSHLRISGFNRVIKDLNGYTKTQLLTQLTNNFIVTAKGTTRYIPTAQHEFSMYIDHTYYKLQLKSHLITDDLVAALAPQIFYTTILYPVLGIKDVRNDDRIQYYASEQDHSLMQQHIDEGRFAIGFELSPIHISQLQAIADKGLTMPPKSTYIQPKLKSGVLIYEF